MNIRRTWFLRIPLLVSGLSLCLIFAVKAQNAGSVSPSIAGPKNTAYASEWVQPQSLPAQAAFQTWTTRYQAATTPGAKAALLAEGVALAKQRRASMLGLIRGNPERALALTVPASVLKQLPAEVLNELESRVSGVGDFSVLGAIRAIGGPAVEPTQRFVRLNGRTYRASVSGWRLGEGTKSGIPLHGIVLDGVMALHEGVLRELEADETPGAATPVIDLRGAAEKSLASPAVFGEAGGRIYRFGSTEQLRQMETRFETAEAQAGPRPAQSADEILNQNAPTGGSSSTNLPNPPSAWTTGGKNILIIRVDFSDLPGAPYSAPFVQSLADSQISPYYFKSSYQQTSLTNTAATPLYRMPQTANYYATNGANDQLHSDAEAAASADYTLANYDRIIVVFPSLGGISGSQITYGGLADVHGPDVWCNGEFDFRVIAHELGHTYGLLHGNLWQVSDGNPISPSGVDTEYGDDFDTMGANFANNQGTDFNPWFKNTLGWIADSQVLTVTSNGTYRVYAFDHNNYLAAPGETLAIKVVKDSTHTYWISCRGDFTNNSSMENGVYVIWGYNFNRQSDLLDMTTPGNSDQDAALEVGDIFNDPATAMTLHPVATGGVAPNEYRDIQIIFGTLPPLAPTISREPQSQTVLLGNSAAFTVAAGGNPAPGYQWQRKATGGSTWSTLTDGGGYTGSGTSNLTVSANNLANSGDQFQCIASNGSDSVTSSPATLTITSGLTVTTLAGQTTNGGFADGTGTNAQFFYPYDVVTDGSGNVYVADFENNAVRKMTPAGVVSTLSQSFFGPQGIAVDAASNIYVANTYDQTIQKVTQDGVVSVLAGSSGSTGTNDGANDNALFNYPWGMAVDGATNIYVADAASSTIRKITPTGPDWVVTTIAGSANNTGSADGTNSDALFDNPAGLAIDAAGNIYVADTINDTIRKITPDVTGTNWVVSTIAGQAGVSGSRDGSSGGKGGNSVSAQFYSPSGVAVDTAGNVYVADTYNALIRKITPQGVVTTLAGSAFNTGSADGFLTGAQFNFPYGVAVDNGGNIYVADTYNHVIRVGWLASVVVPKLAIAASNNQSVVAWPVPIQTFHLQSTTNLQTANWGPVTNVPIVVSGQNYVTNLAPGGAMYFRLQGPQTPGGN